jgi:hypothetical protein
MLSRGHPTLMTSNGLLRRRVGLPPGPMALEWCDPRAHLSEDPRAPEPPAESARRGLRWGLCC